MKTHLSLVIQREHKHSRPILFCLSSRGTRRLMEKTCVVCSNGCLFECFDPLEKLTRPSNPSIKAAVKGIELAEGIIYHLESLFLLIKPARFLALSSLDRSIHSSYDFTMGSLQIRLLFVSCSASV